jgi:hypothetical protein
MWSSTVQLFEQALPRGVSLNTADAYVSRRARLCSEEYGACQILLHAIIEFVVQTDRILQTRCQ